MVLYQLPCQRPSYYGSPGDYLVTRTGSLLGISGWHSLMELGFYQELRRRYILFHDRVMSTHVFGNRIWSNFDRNVVGAYSTYT